MAATQRKRVNLIVRREFDLFNEKSFSSKANLCAGSFFSLENVRAPKVESKTFDGPFCVSKSESSKS